MLVGSCCSSDTVPVYSDFIFFGKKSFCQLIFLEPRAYIGLGMGTGTVPDGGSVPEELEGSASGTQFLRNRIAPRVVAVISEVRPLVKVWRSEASDTA